MITLDSKTSNAGDVQDGCTSRSNGDAATSSLGSNVRCKLFMHSHHYTNTHFFRCCVLQALVRLRLRIVYTAGGIPVQDQTDFAFPAGMMA